MREIKFRAWDKNKKEMIDADSFYFSDEFEPFIDSAKNAQKYFDIMQFTGLHDKNGKEIYEEDIIQFKDVHNERRNGEVLFAKYSWCVNYKDPKGLFGANSMFLSTAESCGFIEIIGNIHENPELVEKGENGKK